MFSSDKFIKVGKVISKFFLFNEGICRSEKSKGVREAVDDDGKNVRILSSSSSADDKDNDDDGDGDGDDGGSADDDNNRGNNGADGGIYSLKGYMHGWI